MASKLFIAEYERLTSLQFGNTQAQCPEEPPIATQVVDFSGGVAPSAAFNVRTRFVRLKADSACHFFFAAAPTATASHPYLAADETEYHGVDPVRDGVYKVSAIAKS